MLTQCKRGTSDNGCEIHEEYWISLYVLVLWSMAIQNWKLPCSLKEGSHSGYLQNIQQCISESGYCRAKAKADRRCAITERGAIIRLPPRRISHPTPFSSSRSFLFKSSFCNSVFKTFVFWDLTIECVILLCHGTLVNVSVVLCTQSALFPCNTFFFTYDTCRSKNKYKWSSILTLYSYFLLFLYTFCHVCKMIFSQNQ